MGTEEWELSDYVVKSCPRCGNATPQQQLAWASEEDYEALQGPDGEVDYMPFERYWYFTQCVTCGRPSVYESKDEGLQGASLVWPIRDEPEPPEVPAEQRHLAAAADLLCSRGEVRAAALLLDCVGIHYRVTDLAYRGNDQVEVGVAVLLVRAPYVDRFDESVCEIIRAALTEASFADGTIVKEALAVAVAEDGDWRDRVERTLGLGETNQAVLLPARLNKVQSDGLNFGSYEEVIVYEALKRLQAELPQTETIGIMPNCAFRAGNGSSFTPDFVVTHRRRAGSLEVDGPHHRGRFASDRSKDELLVDAGIAHAYRIPVEDVSRPEELSAHLQRFLKRLAEG
jgi:hypothetical protein